MSLRARIERLAHHPAFNRPSGRWVIITGAMEADEAGSIVRVEQTGEIHIHVPLDKGCDLVAGMNDLQREFMRPDDLVDVVPYGTHVGADGREELMVGIPRPDPAGLPTWAAVLEERGATWEA
jgi:hypothetical protein